MRKATFIFCGLLALFVGVSLRYADEQVAFLNRRLLQANVEVSSIPVPINRLTDQPINSPQKSATLIFAGDIMLSRGVALQIRQHNDSYYPFLKIADTIRSADFAFANLESPISSRGANQGSIYSFRADPKVIGGLVFAGFDALSVANNHSMDYDAEALEDTLALLRQSGIAPIGAGRNYEEANAPARFAIGDPPARLAEAPAKRAGEAGTRFAILAYTNLYPQSFEASEGVGISRFDINSIRNTINEIRSRGEADLIVISLHWGDEYQLHPALWQRNVAHALVDAGADLIIGHHPHVVQDIERYHNSYIFYSLGNFVFDQDFSPETMHGLMARVTVRDKKIERVESVPIQLNDTFQPSVSVP